MHTLRDEWTLRLMNALSGCEMKRYEGCQRECISDRCSYTPAARLQDTRVCVCVCVTAVPFTSASHKRQNNSVVKCCRSQGRTKVHLAPFKSSKVPPEAPNTCGAVKDTAGVFSVTAGAAHSKRHALSLTEQNSENHFLTVLAWKASMEKTTVCYSHEG